MRIERKELIVGIPILKIRDYLRKFTSGYFSISNLEECFRLGSRQAHNLVRELLNKGYIEYHAGKYRLSLKGRALCIARCVPPLNKEKADRIFQEFMQRVKEVNHDDFYLYRVNKLLLFGSYQNPKSQDFGDIDIAYDLKQKVADIKEFLWQNELLVEGAKQQGHHFPTLWSEISYSRRLVLSRLKNGNRYISLHPIFKEEILNTTTYTEIYP